MRELLLSEHMTTWRRSLQAEEGRRDYIRYEDVLGSYEKLEYYSDVFEEASNMREKAKKIVTEYWHEAYGRRHRYKQQYYGAICIKHR